MTLQLKNITTKELLAELTNRFSELENTSKQNTKTENELNPVLKYLQEAANHALPLFSQESRTKAINAIYNRLEKFMPEGVTFDGFKTLTLFDYMCMYNINHFLAADLLHQVMDHKQIELKAHNTITTGPIGVIPLWSEADAADVNSNKQKFLTNCRTIIEKLTQGNYNDVEEFTTMFLHLRDQLIRALTPQKLTEIKRFFGYPAVVKQK